MAVFLNIVFLHLTEFKYCLEPSSVFISCKKIIFLLYGSQKLNGGSVHGCVLQGNMRRTYIAHTKQLARLFPAKIERLLILYCFFLFTTLCSSCLSSAAMKDVLWALNDGGVDSNSLAEVFAEYFCGDSDGMFFQPQQCNFS